MAQKKERADRETIHYMCIQSSDVYHNSSTCSSLAMCSGGKVRRVKGVDNLKPCPKCVRRQPKPVVVKESGFLDIKKILGVKDKKQIVDSLGTSEGIIHRPGGLTLRITGPPDSRTINMIEFFFSVPAAFREDSLFSEKFYERLGLQFQGCKADTIRSSAPHPVTGKIKKDVAIEYRGCAIVEPRDAYEDISMYYYELVFVARERDTMTDLEKVQLILRAERP
jgi:hypothetical protein